ncbi:MAG: class I SAM-dependent methyltransferase [Paracoccaceae bacterium]
MTDPKNNVFSHLTCPVDASPLELTVLERDAQGRPETGLLLGKTRLYPMILGIPRLIADDTRGPLVAMLQRGDFDAAADLALSWPDKNLSNRVQRKLSKLLLRVAPRLKMAHMIAAGLSTGRSLRASGGTVEDMLHNLESGIFVDWLLHRFSARTFKPLMTLSSLLRPNDLVLDVGGGFGHGAWVLSNHVPPEQIVMVDSVFAHLHVARTRMVQGAHCVAADVSHGLPFDGVAFDSVVMSDTFHFVPDQHQLAGEVMRLLSPQGRLILSQIHNGLIPDEFTGSPRSPQGYLDLFPDLQCAIMPNSDLLRMYAEELPLNIAKETDLKSLEHVSELSLIADRDGSVLTNHAPPLVDTRNLHLASVLTETENGQLEPNTHISEIVCRFLDWPVCANLTATDVLEGDAQQYARSGATVSAPEHYFGLQKDR